MTHRISMRARGNQLFLYSGQSLLITNLDGNVAGADIEGFYIENTRLLCRDYLTANGQPLRTFASSPVRGHGMLTYAEAPTSLGIPAKSVYLEIARLLDAGMRTTVRLTSYGVRDAARFDLAWHLAADFADLEQFDSGLSGSAQFAGQDGEGGGIQPLTAGVHTEWDEARRELVMRYDQPGLDRAVAVRVDATPVPVRFAGDALVFPLDLAPRATVTITVVVEPLFDGVRRALPPVDFAQPTTPLGVVRAALTAAAPVLTTSNPTVAHAWRSAVGDLASLPLGLEIGPAAPSAGVPLYQQFFGRDTLTIGWQAAMAMPEMLKDALRANAALQGTVVDDWRDEQPGKIIHQARTGPLSLLNRDPFLRYYGDYSAPQDFLIMLGQYFAWTNDRETLRALLPAARNVLAWLDRDGDLDGDGFLEYVTRSAKGVKNQGWKDSDEAIIDEHGVIVQNPIATSEMQGYWFAALQQAASVFYFMGERRDARRLLRQARDLRKRFNAAFWMEEEGFYAMALGPDKRQVRSISSNTGHLLTSGIVPKKRAQRVVARLMAPDMFSGWGIRTLSSDHPAYNPFSYHLGSVWPIESATFAQGFGRYGCWDEMHRFVEGVFASTELFSENRLPEAIGGLSRDAEHPHPGIYPEACEPQGWSASMTIMLVQSLLGVFPLAPLGVVLVDPHLPPWLPDMRLDGVRVGSSRLDLAFWRTKQGATDYRVTRRSGHVRVLRQSLPPGEEIVSFSRLRMLIGSLPRS
ncbi:MAG: glycogen debranching N-terminal domain-containing protein [Thermomicrobiales bacterium]